MWKLGYGDAFFEGMNKNTATQLSADYELLEQNNNIEINQDSDLQFGII
jgi:hypothetical protein